MRLLCVEWTRNGNLEATVIDALWSEYNQTIVDIFQNSMTNELRAKTSMGKAGKAVDINVNNDTQTVQTVWAQLDQNLRSAYKSHNIKAIEFVLKVFEGSDDSDSDSEQRAKCLSILNQNSGNLVRILKSDRKGFLENITRILCGVLGSESDSEMKVDIDVVFGAFGFGFMDEYMFPLKR